MPHKKRGHKNTKDAKEQEGTAASPLEVRHSSRFSAYGPTAGSYCYGKSQPSQATPKPAGQVSTVKPAQFEQKASSGSTMATKPGVASTATGGGAGGGVAAGGSASVGTAGKVAPKAKTETNTTPAGATVIDMSSAGVTIVDMTSAGSRGGPKEMSKSASVSQAKATASVPSPVTGAAGAAAAAVTKPKESPKDTAKVQVEVPSAAAKGAKQGPVPADYKPPDVPKPLSTDEALDSLSAGFMSSPVPPASMKQEKKDHVDTISASSAGPASFAPPPVKKSQPPAAVPPADKKAKMEKVSDDFSLEAGLSSAPSKTAGVLHVAVCPPADKKAKMEKGDSMSMDALSALGDLLPENKTKPELPEVRPEDIVTEDKHKREKGVFVGEREDTLPPDYRFDEKELKKLPPRKPEPTLGTGEALDILSTDFMTSSAAPAGTAVPPVAVCPAPPADDFSLEAGLTASTAKKVESSAVPPVAVCPAPPTDKKAQVGKTAAGKDASDGKPKTGQGDSMSMDALSALGDLLPENKTKPELPEVRPEDIVTEDKHKREKGVFVGEREDTLPPDYRFDEKELKKLPPRKPEPTLGTGEALDILSTDFMTSSAAPAVHAPVVKSLAPPAQSKVEDLSALDVLHADFVAPTKASGVQEPVPSSAKKTPEKVLCHQEQQAKPSTDKGDSFSLDALSALSDTLPKETPKPELSKLRPEDIVTEDKHKKEKGVFVGEREDTLPPDYRFDEKELKKLPAPKPEPTLGTGEALDILSGSFVTSSAAAAVHDSVVKSSAPPAKSSADFALDALAGDFVSSTAAPAVKSGFVPTETAPQLETGADSALDALSDTLMDINPAPQPDPVPLKDIVKEKKLVEEKLIKMGERDDTLPPEYRPTEEDLKKAAEAKAKAAAAPKKTMDDKTALDLLSSEFSTVPDPTALAASSAGATKLEPPVLDSDPLKPMAGPVLDSLAGTLVPDTQEFKSKTDKPKGKSKSKSRSKKHHAEEPSPTDQLSAQLSSDVVPTSTKKGGKS
ncbi:calpastatin isoform 10-T10 [Symphorus nematophorus]